MESLNEEDVCDFLDFEENRIFVEFIDNLFNFNNLHSSEIIAQLDLLSSTDEEQLDKSNCNDSLLKSNDLVVINHFPISESHCNLVINCDKNICQVLSNELINQALEIFNYTKKDNLKLGYNSLGAGAIINHLHFELFWTENGSKLAIENAGLSEIIKTRLIAKSKDEEINLFDPLTLLKISKLSNYYMNGWLIQIKTDNKSDDNFLSGNPMESISYVSALITSMLIAREFPHNLIFTDSGTSCYIIPRKFNNKNLGVTTSWLDICGYPLIYDKSLLEKVEKDGIEVLENLFKSELCISNDDLEMLSDDIKDEICSKYNLEN